MKARRFWRRLILISLGSLLVLIWAVDFWVSTAARDRIYQDIGQLPYRKTGLVLGTPKMMGRYGLSYYYKYRIEAAAALFKAGKIGYVIVSGDSTFEGARQPETMRADLMARGVPADRIILDNAGFRTFNSILRCKEVFGADSVTIISQQFHNERALFIAKAVGLNAIAFNARDLQRPQYRTFIREKLARVKMMLDLLTGKKARVQ